MDMMSQHVARRALLGLTVVLGLVAGCSDSGTGPTQTAPPVPAGGSLSFQSQVLPILTSYGCTGCHGGSGGLTVTDVAALKAGGNHGAAVVTGNGAGSNIIIKLGPTPPFGDRMPFGGTPLPDSLIAVIKGWIDQGAKDN
jgi:hypothetical protein